MTGDTWYIDAWCPTDGLAFASRRRGEILHRENMEAPLIAEETVYLCPPFFEPEQIGSLATALAATRGHFQTGFYQEGDKEIPFGSLADVVETVKRVYRGGGGRHLPGTSQPLPISPINGSPNFDTLTDNLDLNEAWYYLKEQLQYPKGDDQSDLQYALREFLRVDTVRQALSILGVLSIISPLKRLGSEINVSPKDIDTIGLWNILLKRAGFYVFLNPHKGSVDAYNNEGSVGAYNKRTETVKCSIFKENMAMFGQAAGRFNLTLKVGYTDFERLVEFDPPRVMDVLHRVPVPFDWPSPYPRQIDTPYRFSMTFGALLCLATSSHIFLQKLSSPLLFVPVMLASMVLNTGWSGRSCFSEDLNQLDEITCYWLSKSFPWYSLGHTVDEHIDRFSIDILEETLFGKSKIG